MGKLPPIDVTQQLLAEAIAMYGERAQLDMMVEECAELTVAIQKYYRNAFKTGISLRLPEEVPNLIDEIADVYVMLMQLRLMVGPSHVDERVAFKLNRLQERLDRRR
jgi:NTP pyrophosphatase (non-canonical NTP hydrolase)